MGAGCKFLAAWAVSTVVLFPTPDLWAQGGPSLPGEEIKPRVPGEPAPTPIVVPDPEPELELTPVIEPLRGWFVNVGGSMADAGELFLRSGFAEAAFYAEHRVVYDLRARVGHATFEFDEVTHSGVAVWSEPSVGFVFLRYENTADNVRQLWTWTAGAEASLLYHTVDDERDEAPDTMKGGLGFFEVASHARYVGKHARRTRMRLRVRGGYLTEAGASVDVTFGYMRNAFGADINVGAIGGATSGDFRLYLTF